MSPLETVLVFGVIPVGLYFIIAAFVFGPNATRRRPRYRPGRRWPYDPVWWMEDPSAVGSSPDTPQLPAGSAPAGETSPAGPSSTVYGGARGNW